MRRIAVMVSVLTVFVCVPASAQDARTLMDDYDTSMSRASIVASTAPDGFGEHVDLYTGATSFSVVPIQVPGNNDLEVSLRFRLDAFDDGNSYFQFGSERPQLSGIFGARSEWLAYTPDGPTKARCSNTAPPPTLESTSGKAGYFEAHEYWHGVHLTLPGGGSQMLGVIGAGDRRPSGGGPYKWATKGGWVFSCIPLKNAEGEGFLGIAPDGKKYYFDYYYGGTEVPPIQKEEPMGGGTTILARRTYRLEVSRIEDRFGNWVSYVGGVNASDGRALTSSSLADGRTSVSDGTNTWYYRYLTDGSGPSGLEVTYPDQSTWKISWVEDFVRINHPATCGDPLSRYSGSGVVTVKNRSGATAVFTFEPVRRGMSHVYYRCLREYSGSAEGYLQYPAVFDGIALVRKQISGPGIANATWNYNYGPSNHCYSGPYADSVIGSVACTGSSPVTRAVIVTGPESYQRYTFGNKWNDTDGTLLKLEEGSSSSTILRTTDFTWHTYDAPGSRSGVAGYNYWSFIGTVQKSAVIRQGGETFSRVVTDFDEFNRPVTATKASSLGYSKSEGITYHDDADDWVLDQVQAVTVNGVQASRADYNAKAMPYRTYVFGKWQQGLTYHADGTLATRTDGNNNITRFGNWKRGTPQTITYQDGTSQSAVVNNDGTLASTTDENDFTTSYAYDGMRLTKITYPAGDSVAWAPRSQRFEPVAVSEYGIPAGHWRQTVSQGNYRQITYFDALWQPLLMREYDTANVSGTQRFTRYAYDHAGRVTFASYPNASSNPTTGTWTHYDALGRPTSVSQDSEYGLLSTLYRYLSGFRTQVTNARKQVTVTSYQAFDQPDTSAPVRIEAPEGVTTTISRNVFGETTAVTRSGN